MPSAPTESPEASTSRVSTLDLRNQEFYPGSEPRATWFRQQSPGTYFWRCKVPARELPGQVLNFTTMDLAERDGEFVFPRTKGTVIWQFPGNATTGTLMVGLQEAGHRVLMEIDDSYRHVPEYGMYGGWQVEIDRDGNTDNYSHEAHAELCKFVDGLIVSTDELADLYSDLNDNIFVCPNSIEPSDWTVSEKPDDGILRIGWGASHSHVTDAPLVRRALKWAADQKDVEVWVFGIGERYKFPGAVKKAPWTDNLTDYRAALSRCDIHICPLYETKWSRYRSDLKALEGAMAGAWPIVSTATPFKTWQDRTMTCTTAKDWQDAIRWAVRHRDEIPRLAQEAKDYVLAERTISKNIEKWEEAIG